MSKKLDSCVTGAEKDEMSLIYVNLFKSPRLKYFMNTIHTIS